MSDEELLLRWLRSRWRSARRELNGFGIGGRVLRVRLVVERCILCRAYVDDGEAIHLGRGWAWNCYLTDDKEEVVAILLHEWAHLLCARRPDIARRLRVPVEYPGGLGLVWSQVKWMLGLIPYGGLNPEEALAERVSSRNPRTLRAIAGHL